MQKKSQLPKGIQLLIAVAVCVFIFSLSLHVYKNYLNPPNLGQDFTFLRTTEMGCYYFAFCSEREEFHYFATDLTQEQIVQYFDAPAEIKNTRYIGGIGSFPTISFHRGNEHFSFEFFGNKNGAQEIFELPSTQKQFIVGISHKDYLLAKEVLRK